MREINVIAVFNSDPYSPYGFGAHECYKIKSLHERGHLFLLLCRDPRYAPFDKRITGAVLPCGNLSFKSLSFITKLSRFMLAPHINLIQDCLFDSVASSKLVKIVVKTQRDDIANTILFTTPSYPQVVYTAKKIGFRVLYTTGPHPSWILEEADKEYQRYGLKNMHSSFNRKNLNRHIRTIGKGDYFMVPTKFAKETMLKYGISGDKVFVNPFGVDLKHYTPSSIKSDRFTFLFVGDVTLLKGLQYLLLAWSELRLKDAHLLVVGDILYDARKIIRSISRKLINVSFLGHIKDVRRIYRKANVFVLPSLVEGMARVTLEAMASGLPVITTPVSNDLIENGKDGFLIKPRDVRGLKEAILYFYDNPYEATRMGGSARSKVSQYDWERYSRRTADIIESL